MNKFVFEGRGAWYENFFLTVPFAAATFIVFKFPFDDHPHYVKRVIGLPASPRIINQRVYINGPSRGALCCPIPWARIPSATTFLPPAAIFSKVACGLSGLRVFRYVTTQQPRHSAESLFRNGR